MERTKAMIMVPEEPDPLNCLFLAGPLDLIRELKFYITFKFRGTNYPFFIYNLFIKY